MHNLTRNLVDLFLSDDRNKYGFETISSGDRVIKKLLILDEKLLIVLDVSTPYRDCPLTILFVFYVFHSIQMY